jgi:hypothetical protein
MQMPERVKALTQDALLPKVVDNVLNSNVLSLRLIGNAKQWKGEALKKSIKYQSSGTAASFSGLDTFSASQLTTKVRMEYDPRGVRIPAAAGGMEASVNAVSETQVTDLVKEALEECEQELIDEIGDQIYGDGTGNSSKDFLGLGAIVDDGTSVATIGGLSRTTYPVLASTVTASGGTLTLAKLATLYTNIASGSENSSPTLMVSNETVWDLYEQLLTPMVRENYTMSGYLYVGAKGGASRKEGLGGTQGFTAVTYKGIPWVRDEKATAQTVFMLNEKWLQWYGLDAAPVTGYKKISLSSEHVEGLYDEAPMSNYTGFNWSGWRTPTNQFAIIADILVLGNLTSWQPRRHGKLTGVTGV